MAPGRLDFRAKSAGTVTLLFPSASNAVIPSYRTIGEFLFAANHQNSPRKMALSLKKEFGGAIPVERLLQCNIMGLQLSLASN
jgi:hypothetical protein